MTTLVRREVRHPLAELFDWTDSLPSMLAWPPMRGVRIEEFIEDGRYVVKAELPGLDPAKDVKVEVANGLLTITATRERQEHDGARSEFHYGSLTRQVMLPDGADEAAIQATYDAGILEVSVPVTAKSAETRTVPIEPKA